MVSRLKNAPESVNDCELVDYLLENEALETLKGGPCESLRGTYTGEIFAPNNHKQKRGRKLIDYPNGRGVATLSSGDSTHYHRWEYTGAFEGGTTDTWCKMDHRTSLHDKETL